MTTLRTSRRGPLTLLVSAGLAALALPAVAQEAAVVIRGGTVHTLAGPPIAGGTVVLRGERIEAVGADLPTPAGATVVDASGLHVYPGLFDAVSRLGLTEVGSVSATEDMEELGDYNPELDAAVAVHPASEHIPVARANGVTHTLTTPGSGGGGFAGRFGGGVMPGRGSLIHLDGWTIEEMLIRPGAALVLNWPTIRTRSFDFATFSVRDTPFTEAKKEYDKAVGDLEEWLAAAEHYAHAVEHGSPEHYRTDLKLAALVPVLHGDVPVLLMANQERDIKNGIDFCKKHGLKVILAGGADAWKVADLLAKDDVPVILRPSQSLPTEEDEPYDKPLTNAGELFAAGVKVAFGTFGSSNSRLLPYEAANTVAYGLPHDEALKAITLNPAEIFGVADQLGTVEPGKLGNLIVTDGDPLEIPTHVVHLFIKGHEVSTDNKHRRLYERYRARP